MNHPRMNGGPNFGAAMVASPRCMLPVELAHARAQKPVFSDITGRDPMNPTEKRL